MDKRKIERIRFILRSLGKAFIIGGIFLIIKSILKG